MIQRPVRWLLLLVVLVAGCGKKRIVPPAEQTLELGTKKATYRTYPKADICGADPRLLKNDLESMNALLIDFLGVTSAGFTGMWADEHVTMLEQGLERLPAPLAAHEAAFAAVRDCGFDEKLELTEPARQAEELAAQTRRRLEAGPELLPFARAKRDLDKWKVEQDTKREEARARTCRGAATAAKIFYAAEDEKGRTAWWFCDGSEVSIAPGGELTYAQGTAKRAAKKPKSYVTSTGKFPPGEIQRSPKLPARKLAPAPAKEEHDVLEPNDGL